MLKHKHLVVTARVNYASRDPEMIEAWLTLVIKYIGMNLAKAPTLAKNPQAYYCEIEGNMGITGMAILETSHAAIHIWDEEAPCRLEFDIYSCADFDPKDIIKLLSIFEPTSIEYKFLDREEGIKVISEKNGNA